MALNDWTKRFLKNPVGVAWEKSISPPHGYQMVMKPSVGLYYGVGKSSPIEMGDKYTKLFNSKYQKAVETANGEYAHAKVEVPTGMMSLEAATGLNNGGLTFNIDQIDGEKLLAEII